MRPYLFLILLASVCVNVNARAALPGAEPLATLIDNQFDVNADGGITAEEWKHGIDEGFTAIDVNADNELSANEIESLTDGIASQMNDLVAALVVPLIKKLILSADADKDGKITRKEFTTNAESMFKKLDADHDSKVTHSELLELPVKLIGG
jgi:Ca2+-binding EF-hand superfamily protein